MLEIKNLTVKYEKTVLENVNLKLDKKIYGLMGMTGSGKTTFIKAILGLIKCEGEILLDGKQLDTRKGFQIIFQNSFNSFDSKRNVGFSISEIIRLNSSNYTLEELVEKVEINPGFIDKYPSELSGGELQRLSIARALAGNPQVFILDEPTSALDVENQKKILDILKEIKDVTTIFISHDMNVLKYISDEILILNLEKKNIEYQKI